MPSLAFIAVFFAVSLIPLVAMPFYKKPQSGETRIMKKKPELIQNGKPNFEFFTQLDDFFSDNFAYRLEMVNLNELLYTAVLNHSTNRQVILGKDGWLYFEETVSDYIGKTNITLEQTERLVTILSLQSEYLKSKGIEYIFTAAPNKNSVYPQFMPDRIIKSRSPSSLEILAGALKSSDVHYTDLHSALLDAKKTGYLYHKTDTHWNDLGARAAANRLMNDIKSLLSEFEFNGFENARAARTTTPGDLKKMLFPLAKSANEGYTTLTLDNIYTVKGPYRSPQDTRITTTSRANPKRIVMFRDSFGDALIPFISNNFGYAYYSKEFPVNLSDIDSHGPDIVVYEIAQRNIPKLLERAPVMPALKRQPIRLTASNTGGRMFVRVAGDLVHIYGYLNKDNKTSYRCYLTDTAGQSYEAFPILESERLNMDGENGRAGFSLYLNTGDYAAGDFTVTMDLGGQLISHTFKNQEVSEVCNSEN